MDTPIQIDPESNELTLNKTEITDTASNPTVVDSGKTSDSTETKQTNSNSGSNQLTESTQVFNDSLNMDVTTKPSKKGYPTDEESIFMKDSSNEENNSQTELNVSSAVAQTTATQPVKRNFAVKNTSANVLKQNNTNNVKVNFRKKQPQYKLTKKNEEDTTVGFCLFIIRFLIKHGTLLKINKKKKEIIKF